MSGTKTWLLCWFTATEWALPVEEVLQPQATGGGAHPIRLGGGHGGAAAGSDRFALIALPPETNLLKLDIISGRSLQSGDVDALVVNTALASKSAQMKVGKLVSIRIGHVDTSLRLVGIAREAFSPPVAYVPRRYIEQRGDHPHMANNLRLVLNKTDAASIESIKAALDRNLEAEGIRALSTISKADSRFGLVRSGLRCLSVWLRSASFCQPGAPRASPFGKRWPTNSSAALHEYKVYRSTHHCGGLSPQTAVPCRS